MSDTSIADRNLAMEAVRVTEAAALAGSRFMGRGDERVADEAALDAMHAALASLAIEGTVRIGEGLEGEVAKLYVGEKVGSGAGLKMDVAAMALEGPTIIAKGEPNGLSVIALTEQDGFLDVPAIYMDKIAIGAGLPADLVDLDETPDKNLRALAKAKGAEVGDMVACILDRPRHADLIAKTREAGARIMLIRDGDVSGVIATTWPDAGVDIYLGIGGAPQGVLAAAALNCVGGQMQGRLVVRGNEDKALCARHGIAETDRKYRVADMAAGAATFAATGVTGGHLLAGVRGHREGAVTHSVVMRSKSGTVRYIEAHHDFTHRPGAAGGRPK
jgi:fructose-1,6-bisphosphatase II / sedoheptulose-1,7-bisphosphatase